MFLADKSVDGPALSNELFFFTKRHVGALTSNDFMTLDDWVTSSLPGSSADLILQTDIEGYEYESFLHHPRLMFFLTRLSKHRLSSHPAWHAPREEWLLVAPYDENRLRCGMQCVDE